VLDEVDAALDNVNVKKVCNYISHVSHDFQCIVISLKDMFYEHSDSLVGICKDVESLSSKILTLDLSKYKDVESNEEPQTPTTIGNGSGSITSYRSGSRTAISSGPGGRNLESGMLGKRKQTALMEQFDEEEKGSLEPVPEIALEDEIEEDTTTPPNTRRGRGRVGRK
jgi:hypothetical protein